MASGVVPKGAPLKSGREQQNGVRCHICQRRQIPYMSTASDTIYVNGVKCHTCQRRQMPCVPTASDTIYINGVRCHICPRRQITYMSTESDTIHVNGVRYHICETTDHHITPLLPFRFGEPKYRLRQGWALLAARIHGRYSVGSSLRPMCTRCCFTMTNMIQVCSNFL